MSQSTRFRPAFGRLLASPLAWLIAGSLLLWGCDSLPQLTTDDGATADDKGDSDSDGSLPSDDDGLNIDSDDGSNSDGSSTGGGTGNDSICGNKLLEAGELCDDGNTKSDDGCSKDCKTVDPDFACLVEGEACVRVVTCGNGIIEGSEACDDGTTVGGDGCSADCKTIENGYVCSRPGRPCALVPICGNGIRERGEGCDDAQATPTDGDGCSATCQIEDANAWYCVPGEACVARACGNGVRTPDEACDGGIGCTGACQPATGYRCSSSGCRPICGDGLIVGTVNVDREGCDDGDNDNGDGCSSVCSVEAFFNCSGTPSVCSTTIVCGNGTVDPGEVCDSNISGCVMTGPTACQAFDNTGVDVAVCGNGKLELGEACDGDGALNHAACSASCVKTTGYECPAAGYCYLVPACGDGKVQPGEECDVGAMSALSCNGCIVQAGYYCSGTAPSVCVASVCGDGTRAPNEACDDHNTANNDGCSSTCTVESDWVCPPNTACVTKCGNGIVTFPEECEFSGTGCTNCKIDKGYDCGTSGTACVTSRCGNGVVEHGEGCDNDVVATGVTPVAGDGCGATCQKEPTITPAASSSGYPTVAVTCGDGIKTGSEKCDDGNNTPGDGCPADCGVSTGKVEDGWTCSESVTYPGSIKFKVTYRDFDYNSHDGGHPHMRNGGGNPSTGDDSGIPGALCKSNNTGTCGRLDSAGKPQYAGGTHNTITTGGGTTAYNTTAFGLWYRDTNATSLKDAGGVSAIGIKPNPTTVPAGGDTITLGRVGTTSAYQFSNNSNTFYPLDGRGFGNYTSGGATHNWNFTSELRYFFQYQGGETLTFFGDDDVFVFINGRFAVDIGGIHGTEYGRVVLGDDGDGGGTDSNCTVTNGGSLPALGTCLDANEQLTANIADDKRFNLTKGSVYEIVIFQAERNPTGSNYQLTLDGFIAPRSFCSTTCGDSIVAGVEQCDAGTYNASTNPNGNKDGIYNRCNTSCQLTFCGDGTKTTPPEACDNGVNSDVYVSGSTTGKCAPGCATPGKCGDGVLQPSNEVCDDGVNAGGYGKCKAGCQTYDGYCGDHSKNGPEDCDSVVKVSYQAAQGGCGFDCKFAPYCGDGIRNGDEHCDGGLGCGSDCHFVPYCGDGLLASTGEECDYGASNYNGSAASAPYAGCTTSCLKGPYCGDGTSNGPEDCDEGDENQDNTYNECTTSCTLGPRCGDGIYQSAFGEACDNGFNEDLYAYPGATDSCGLNCSAVPYCGDNVVQNGYELCDLGDALHATDGDQNNDTTYDGCTTTCEYGPFCGDGVKQSPQEECDDPTGNKAYGQGKCGYDCKPAPYCGDAIRNGSGADSEECDMGTSLNTGGYGGCTAACKRGPYCGDGKVDKSNGEQCDAGANGSLTCTPACKARNDVPK